jgi:hypothetical protein
MNQSEEYIAALESFARSNKVFEIPKSFLNSQFIIDAFYKSKELGIEEFEFADIFEHLMAYDDVINNLSADLLILALRESKFIIANLLPDQYITPKFIKVIYTNNPSNVLVINNPDHFDALNDEELLESLKANPQVFIDEIHDGNISYYKYFISRFTMNKFAKALMAAAKIHSQHLCRLNTAQDSLLEYAVENKKVTKKLLQILYKYGYRDFDAYIDATKVVKLFSK